MNFSFSQETDRPARRARRAFCWLMLLTLAFAPTAARGADSVELSAGDPVVLKHPPINDSIGNPVHCLTFLPEGDVLATGASSGVLLWDVHNGKLRQTLDADVRAVDSIAVDPTGQWLVAGGASGKITIWDTRTMQKRHTLDAAPGAVRGLSISPDGKLLASASPRGQLGRADKEFGILLWDLAAGKRVQSLPHPSPDLGITGMAFFPDGKRLLSAQDREFRVVDVSTGETVRTIEAPELTRSFGAVALSADGALIVTGAFEPAVRVWEFQSGRQSREWPAHDREAPPRRGVSAIGLSADGRYVLTGGMDGMVCVWEAASGRRLLEVDGRGETSGRWITGVAMTKDGGWLAASHFGGNASIWKITEKNPN